MKAEPRKVRFSTATGFGQSYKRFAKTNPEIKEPIRIFNEYKRDIPPRRLPSTMKDHKLTGDLSDYLECHLASDILLIYTHANDKVKLYRVCRHKDIMPPQAKAFAKLLRTL